MKLIMESWRRFLNEVEEETTIPKPKAIYMAGGPGSGKSTVLKGLGLKGKIPIINADATYEAGLKDAGLSLGGKPEVYTRIKELKAELETNPDDEEKQAQLAKEKEKMSQYAKLFNKGQAVKKADVKKYSNPPEGVPQNFIVDGTAGNYSEMVKEKKRLETMKPLGYDVAMVYVDLDMETALQRNTARGQPDPKTGKPGRQLLDREVKSSHAAVKKNKDAYEALFGQNFFEVNAGDDTIESDTAKIKPAVDAFLAAESLDENDYPITKQRADKEINQVIRPTKKKNARTKLPGWKREKANYKGSAPPGAGGS